MTDISTAGKKPRKPLWRRLLKWTLRVIVVLIVLGITTYALVNYWAAKTIREEVARIRAAGEPITFAELDGPMQKVDPDQDAAPFYTAATALMRPITYDEEKYPGYGDAFRSAETKPAPQFLDLARQDLEKNKLTLELIDRGSAFPACAFDLQLQYGISAAIDHLGPSRGLLNVASLRTRSLAFEGKMDPAVQSFSSSLGLLRMYDRQPILIHALVQYAGASIFSQDIPVIVENGTLSEASLQALEDSLQKFHLLEPRRIYLAERVYFMEISRNLIAGAGLPDASGVAPPQMPESWPSTGIGGRVLAAKAFSTFARMINGCTGDWPSTITATEALAKSPQNMWDQIIAPSFAHAVVGMAKSAALVNSARVVVQIERYRLAHNGSLPDTLAQLPHVASLPADPFTNKPLLYAKIAEGYCVFTAGGPGLAAPADLTQNPGLWAKKNGLTIRVH